MVRSEGMRRWQIVVLIVVAVLAILWVGAAFQGATTGGTG